MAYNTKKLLTDRNGDPIPQSYDSDGDRYVPSEIDTRLKAIENQQQEILERLDKPIDTQVTGSNVEYPSDYPDSKANERLEAIEQTQESIISALQSTNEHLSSVIKDDKLQSNTVLNGSNIEDNESLPTSVVAKQEIEILMDSVVINAKSASRNVYMRPNGASEIYLFIQIDQSPWTLEYRNQFGSVSSFNGYPELKNVGESYGRAKPAISFPLGYNNQQGIPQPSNLKEAKDWGLPITSSEYFKLRNESDEDATATVSMLRVWR